MSAMLQLYGFTFCLFLLFGKSCWAKPDLGSLNVHQNYDPTLLEIIVNNDDTDDDDNDDDDDDDAESSKYPNDLEHSLPVVSKDFRIC
jgi:hypothetical protein